MIPEHRKLAARRVELSLSQTETARRAGVSPTYLCHVERGRRRASPALLRRLRRVLREAARDGAAR